MLHGLQFSLTADAIEVANNLKEVGDSLYDREAFLDGKVEYIQTQILKIGYPILWGLFSFIFLIIGIKKQWKNLRIIALSLLGITIVKLFVYDIRNASEGGKILAFVLLGVLVLVISFVYQKIKKLVVDETEENKTGENKTGENKIEHEEN